jgi:deglycase
MAQELAGKRVEIVVTDGFEQVELEQTEKALEEAGARTEIVSPKPDKVKGWNFTDWGSEFQVDKQITKADPDQYDALMLLRGQMNPDNLRLDQATIRFIGSFVRSGKPIAAICHGPLTLIEADAVKGQTDDLISFDQDRSAKCRRRMDRSGGCDGQWTSHEPHS